MVIVFTAMHLAYTDSCRFREHAQLSECSQGDAVCRAVSTPVGSSGRLGAWPNLMLSPTPTTPTTRAAALEALVGDWSYLPDIAARYGVPLSRVRRHLADRELLTHRVGPNRALAVPSEFLGPLGPRPELKGTFTVLADGGMSDLEIIRWLHTVDTTLPGGDTPLTALAAGFKTEIRRRAQALAF
jgi:hypothetical protein